MVQNSDAPTFVVEHLDPELGEWSALEYEAIAQESAEAGVKFCLSSVPPSIAFPSSLRNTPGFSIEHRGIEDMYASNRERVCLLDPKATKELAPGDAEEFDVFLFGGILGMFVPKRSANPACSW